MNATELSVIKSYQKDFETKFNKKLEIDWYSMKSLRKVSLDESPPPEELLKESVNKFKASMDVIKSGKRLSKRKCKKEKLAVQDYCKKVAFYNIDYKEAAELIKRDRSMIYYYEKML